jgi:hypothetical protein
MHWILLAILGLAGAIAWAFFGKKTHDHKGWKIEVKELEKSAKPRGPRWVWGATKGDENLIDGKFYDTDVDALRAAVEAIDAIKPGFTVQETTG